MTRYFKSRRYKAVSERYTDLLGRRRVAYNLFVKRGRGWKPWLWCSGLDVVKDRLRFE